MADDKNELVYRDGHLCVRYSYAELDRPIRHVCYWSFGETTLERAQDFIGKEIRDPRSYSGAYEVKLEPYQWTTLHLPEGGKTIAKWTEVEEIPQPKVRRNIETRYYSGYWQKYLVSKGWVRI